MNLSSNKGDGTTIDALIPVDVPVIAACHRTRELKGVDDCLALDAWD
jgi:hypothetical protein